ncbi:hypothetical protein J2128_002337 [Methanomicrobium sp. W14]|uniref:hypothetical protein n=1 Tax=Methanomicrobium sp. W14 TaxID=2817839 RepID=UPI001AE66932|nr:hypothetical protein [Methanomicrobium sp. W14]MBP2134371.1 hypothetical protein [Methanomicrobium sp. W14]
MVVVGLAYNAKSVMAVWDQRQFSTQIISAGFAGPYLWMYRIIEYIVKLPCRHYHEEKKEPPKKKPHNPGELDFDDEWVWDD